MEGCCLKWKRWTEGRVEVKGAELRGANPSLAHTLAKQWAMFSRAGDSGMVPQPQAHGRQPPRESTPYDHPHDRQQNNQVPEGRINRRTKGANYPEDRSQQYVGSDVPTHPPSISGSLAPYGFKCLLRLDKLRSTPQKHQPCCNFSRLRARSK